MKTTKTVWSIFRDLVNSKSIGTEITRQEILNQVELAKTNTLGRYIIVEHFATDYTVSQLRKDYDNGNRCKHITN